MDNITINMPETIGHEVFIHLMQYMEDYIKFFEANDTDAAQQILDKHKKGNPLGARDHLSLFYRTKKAQKYYDFINQLRSVLNPNEVQKHVEFERQKGLKHAKAHLDKSQ